MIKAKITIFDDETKKVFVDKALLSPCEQKIHREGELIAHKYCFEFYFNSLEESTNGKAKEQN